jgi:hypothetical protein
MRVQMASEREPCKWGHAMAASEFLSAGKNLGMYIESVVLSARS